MNFIATIPGRADKVIASLVYNSGLSRNRIQTLIKQRLMQVNGCVINSPRHPINIGDQIIVQAEEDEIQTKHTLQPFPMKLDIVYEDNFLMVINKPIGITVHPGAGTKADTLANGLVAYLGSNLSYYDTHRPGIVHRLDRNTSGLIVIAKTNEAHYLLTSQIKKRAVRREYWAIVYGALPLKCGKIETFIKRSDKDRTKMMVTTNCGKLAITHYQLIKSYGPLSLVQCLLETGRTHQIRVHMYHKKCPIVGDKTYGKSLNYNLNFFDLQARAYIVNFPRQALHAKTLSFQHPFTKEQMFFEADLPDDIKGLIDQLESSLINAE